MTRRVPINTLRHEARARGVEVAFFDHFGKEWRWRRGSLWSSVKKSERAALEEGVRLTPESRRKST